MRGDLKQLRWLFHTALGDAATTTVSDKEMVGTSALSVRTGITKGKSKTSQIPSKGGGHFERSLKDQLELWEEYLKAETVCYLILSYPYLVPSSLLIAHSSLFLIAHSIKMTYTP